ncbi:MAG: pyrroline-5-carboxylate reductase [Candidatus Electrothrix sp. LOE1_4_5]|jgi:pyrroline-5-carboxylate reductase|nr:pyrroline-5-carboxylate reductase [Candidatus Electrothrix sp. AX1]MCI5117357.1 pyrroline-5-carboxylate reductase [Candidatus Electrothrix gigas]MCI5181635.1 pyrroline-5-carboxylate reductase [Candidatus Electrothrix gigas]MCI5188584.1 pyrroline-5-carboxylate reductase [Candidatus Electrothrix gigas]MCI5191547.1 pyrroline-5-carboxylate reductase [Candidatus Electrothrix gigas]
MKEIVSVGMVGGGQMGEALIRGMIESNLISAKNIAVAEPMIRRREYLESTYKVNGVESPAELTAKSQIIILAIKPQIMEPVLRQYSSYLREDHLLISIAAGIPLVYMEQFVDDTMRIIRVMPNTPALVLAGASAMTGNQNIRQEDMEVAQQIFSAVGTCVEVPENLLDAVTGLSGSGPGYVFTFLEAMIDGGVLAGLPRPIAEQLAVQTLYGSAKLALETKEPAAVLKGKVTSPAGTTITGIQALEEGGLRGTVMTAVEAAAGRSKALGQ